MYKVEGGQLQGFLSGCVRLCPDDFERAGQAQRQILGGFAGVCPACPADFQLLYVTRMRARGFLPGVFFRFGLGTSFLTGQAGQKKEISEIV